jgi:hypothetical protein
MTNLSQQLQTPAVPDLPNPQEKYDRLTVAQTNAGLRTFFIKLTNAIQSIFSPRGARFLNAPYGAFQDTSSQTATVNTATALKFNQTDYSNGVVVNSTTKLQVTYAGIYNLQFSVQVENQDNAIHDMSIWLRKGNDGGGSTDISGSTGVIGLLARKTSTEYYHNIVGWNYFIEMAADDYIQIYWSTDSTTVSIQAYSAATSPTRPSTASAVATLTFISNLSA